MSLAIETCVECESWRSIEGLEGLIERCVQTSLVETSQSLSDEAEVSLLLSDDARIHKLNAEFRGIDKPTNVLSFPGPEPVGCAHVLGDIAVAYETVAREAKEQGKRLQDHFCHMIVHGFLHLLGFDHEMDQDAEVMEATEIRILQRIGLPDPYADHMTRSQ